MAINLLYTDSITFYAFQAKYKTAKNWQKCKLLRHSVYYTLNIHYKKYNTIQTEGDSSYKNKLKRVKLINRKV